MDFSIELGRLLSYISKVAIAIRMHSAYSGGRPYRETEQRNGKCYIDGTPTDFPPDQQSLHDVMWLSDSLHNFDYLGCAIETQNIETIVSSCEMLSSKYRMYRDGTKTAKSDSKTTFDINAKRIALEEAIAIFDAIKKKALAAKLP